MPSHVNCALTSGLKGLRETSATAAAKLPLPRHTVAVKVLQEDLCSVDSPSCHLTSTPISMH